MHAPLDVSSLWTTGGRTGLRGGSHKAPALNPGNRCSSKASRGPQRVVMSSAAELLGPQRSFAVRDEYSAGAQRQREASPFRQSRAYESSSLSKDSGPGPDVAFAKRIQLAWNVLFPTDTPKSVAEIAKARLRLVLASDRMAVSPALKRELCSDIVNSMQEFVVVDKGKEVQFAVQRSQDSGSVYLVQVPVTRVRPRLQLDLQDLEP